jgi:hypothetical protein
VTSFVTGRTGEKFASVYFNTVFFLKGGLDCARAKLGKTSEGGGAGASFGETCPCGGGGLESVAMFAGEDEGAGGPLGTPRADGGGNGGGMPGTPGGITPGGGMP